MNQRLHLRRRGGRPLPAHPRGPRPPQSGGGPHRRGRTVAAHSRRRARRPSGRDGGHLAEDPQTQDRSERIRPTHSANNYPSIHQPGGVPLTDRPPDVMPQALQAVPRVATTWKLRIPWKLRTHIACFISAGCKVSTLTARQAPIAGLLSGARSSTAPRLSQVTGTAFPGAEVSRALARGAGPRVRVADDEPGEERPRARQRQTGYDAPRAAGARERR